ncbi:hypothetical protein ALP10_200051 [Pseudomonas syringae pv. helianthi]|uniref:Uncharacterized protein n=1 Tax=Pseudomonas syringae pv. helianthi TaxID=251654 RepID=A0A3M6CHA3_9PSED|nr:hypothetical protein [Pseudomonas syringae group genomosp. 7]RMV42764.1 hypothetical protein ALP10_200051 [Pseudomonas syringae pv. helianthi]
MTTRSKYIRTEPPALLTEPQTVTLDGRKLDALNAYRQARHVWLSCEGDAEEKLRLHVLVIDAGAELAGFIGLSVQSALGEPDDWLHD